MTKPSKSGPVFSWDALLAQVRRAQPELYRSWFEELPPAEPFGGAMQVQVSDAARAQYLNEHCRDAFGQAVMALTGHLVSVRFGDPSTPTDIRPSSGPAPYLAQSPLSADYVFEQFVVGNTNRLAHASCRAVVSQPGTLYNPLFLHGPSGVGKTHLLQATCSEWQTAHDGMKVLYVSCEAFVNDFVRAIESGDLQRFRDAARGVDALVVDDVQFLAERETSQEELFHTFNAVYQAGKQMVFSADSPPSEIPTLEDRLVSRFNWGLVTQMDVPNRETRQAILQKKARLRGCEIPADVLDYIAERVQSNVRSLEGALTKLISEAQLTDRPMSLETAREVLQDVDGRPARLVQVGEILELVAEHYSLRIHELIGRRRSRSISHPRQMGMYLTRKLTPLSLEEIGMHFGGRDHTTVLHAERVIEQEQRTNKDTAETLKSLMRQLLSRR